MIKYSIIIPTCNKGLTKRCLKYLTEINKPREEYEVLVIHNVTKDDVKGATEAYRNIIPNLRYLYEEQYGQMSARHRGAREARGEILCYLDDDSFVDTNWLIAIEETFANPDVVLAGGNNMPLYESVPPKWLNYFWSNTSYGKYMGELSLINFYNKEMKIPAWFAFGCNFIIKKEIFYKMGGTHPDVVPKDKQRFQGDGETALSLALNHYGYVLNFNPKIRIHHFVPQERMTLGYFQKRAFYQGVCDSFSKIRKDNGVDYFDFIYNVNIDPKLQSKKLSLFLWGYNKVKRIVSNKIKGKNYDIYLYIKSEYEKSYNEGFNFHQNEVKDDPELLKWVLKKNYLDW